MEEIYKKYRPSLLKQVVGQREACAKLNRMLKRDVVPHALMFTGPSGCGKTTLARIMKNKLECSPRDFFEINCADFRGVEMVRDIRGRMGFAPIGGKCRVWLIDEAHQLSKDAQNALLKMLEEPPGHVYFMLATTDPGKLLRTIQTRCHEIRVKSLSPKEMEMLLWDILSKEGRAICQDAIERIIDCAEGSARKALVYLEQVIGVDDEEEQVNAILSSETKKQAIDLARALMNPRVKWSEISKLLKSIDEEPEQIRHLVLGYTTSVMLNGGKMLGRANLIINAMRDNFYDCKKAGLVSACFEIVGAKS